MTIWRMSLNFGHDLCAGIAQYPKTVHMHVESTKRKNNRYAVKYDNFRLTRDHFHGPE